MTRAWKTVSGGVLAALVALAAIYAAGLAQRSYQHGAIQRDAALLAAQVANTLQASLERHRVALEQMANFWENSEEVTETEFRTFAERTRTLAPSFRHITAVDTGWHVRWIEPEAGARALEGIDLQGREPEFRTILLARRTGNTVVSPPLEFLDGKRGFLLVAPMSRRGKPIGDVAGAFESSRFFGACVPPEVLDRYEASVTDADGRLFETDGFERARSEAPVGTESVRVAGRNWDVRLRPRDEVYAASLRSGQAAYGVVGGLLALAVGALAAAATDFGSSLLARWREQKERLSATEDHLAAAREKLVQAEKLSAVGELVAGVAHELNNPLSSILGYSELLATRETRPDVKRKLEVIAGEAGRAGKIVQNLLTFARKHPPKKTDVQLNEVVHKTVELKAYHLRTHQIELGTELDPALPTAHLDGHQIQQVLLNLLNNAEQAIVDKRVGGRIEVSTRWVGGLLELRVADDGPGIPVEDRERIFEPFFTTKPEGRGTGLGLPLCVGIVGDHGGTLSVESTPGKGTTFTVRLPRTAGDESPVEEEPRPAAPPAALRVLVVEDEEPIRQALVERLNASGHSVTTAADIPEAVERVGAGAFDVVLCDMRLPGGSGRDLYAAIRRTVPGLERRMVFTTGDGAGADTQAFLREAGTAVVYKPFRYDEIERAMAAVVRG